MKKISLLTLLILSINLIFSQGLMVNEVSNGASGNKEYIEMVVIGPICGTVDIRNWIIDDNNGDFSCGPITGVGIAQGHVRFTNNISLAAIPVGSIVIVHNDLDPIPGIPANDPTDLNSDKVYVIPLSSTLLERTSGTSACPLDPGDQIPLACGAACPATGSSQYSPSIYVNGGSITQISLANTADASQTRLPDGTYFHGISYGGAAITGGPDGLKLFTTGTDRNFFFNNGNFRNALNWSVGCADILTCGVINETPGSANNLLNQVFLDSLRNCPLPIEDLHFDVYYNDNILNLEYKYIGKDNIKLNLQYSNDLVNFQTFKSTNVFAEILNPPYFNGDNYFRIEVIYEDGSIDYSEIEYVNIFDVTIFNNLEIFDILGKKVSSDYFQSNSGIYILKSGVIYKKVLK